MRRGLRLESKMEQLKELYKDNFTEYLLCLALDMGEGMLKCGGEVARVEQTIERICRAYGAAHVEVFSIISVIHAAIRMPDGSYSSQMRRVKSTSTDLYKLEIYNEISRTICRELPPLAELDARLHEVKGKRAYPDWVTVPASALAAASFAVFFGGGLPECLFAVLVGAVVGFLDWFAANRLNDLAKIVISAFFAGLLSSVAALVFSSVNSGEIMVGTIMLLVPGVAFGTALRDLLCGDLIAGGLKTVQAILTALMIAFGYLLSMLTVA